MENQLTPIQSRLLRMAVEAYKKDAANVTKHVSGWGWRKLFLVKVGEQLHAMGLVEVMYTGTGNTWYRALSV